MIVISREYLVIANKCLNVRERVEVVERNKMVSSLPLLSCELSMSVKENPDRKKRLTTMFSSISITKICLNVGNYAREPKINFWQIKQKIRIGSEKRLSIAWVDVQILYDNVSCLLTIKAPKLVGDSSNIFKLIKSKTNGWKITLVSSNNIHREYIIIMRNFSLNLCTFRVL